MLYLNLHVDLIPQSIRTGTHNRVYTHACKRNVPALMHNDCNVASSLAPDCSRLQSSPNTQSGKYNEMDPILIGTVVSVVSYTTDSTALVPSWNVCREGNERNKVGVRDYKNQGVNKKFLPAFSLVIEIYPEIARNALSLLDNSLNIHHFGMWKVDWLSWRSWLYSSTKFAPWS